MDTGTVGVSRLKPEPVNIDDLAIEILGLDEVIDAQKAAKTKVDSFFKKEDQELADLTIEMDVYTKVIKKVDKDFDKACDKLYDSFEKRDVSQMQAEELMFAKANGSIDTAKSGIKDASKKIDAAFGIPENLDAVIDEFAAKAPKKIREIQSPEKTKAKTEVNEKASFLSSFFESLTKILSSIFLAFQKLSNAFAEGFRWLFGSVLS